MKMEMQATLQEIEAADVIDRDEFLYSIKKRIYLQAKEGFAINLQVLISRVESQEIRNVLVNQVSYGKFSISLNTRNFLHFLFFAFPRMETKKSRAALAIIERSSVDESSRHSIKSSLRHLSDEIHLILNRLRTSSQNTHKEIFTIDLILKHMN